MTTEERLARLERKNRRLTLALVLMGVAATLVVTVGMERNEAVSEVVKARNFLLVDENGKTRAALEMIGDESSLVLSDKSGKERATLKVDNDFGPDLRMLDENGKTLAMLVVVKGDPFLDLSDENGRARAKLVVSSEPGSGPRLDMWDKKNRTARTTLAVFCGSTSDPGGSGSPCLSLNDENGKRRATMELYDTGPWLGLSDKNGKTRAEMKVLEFLHGPSLGLFDENGGVLRGLP